MPVRQAKFMITDALQMIEPNEHGCWEWKGTCFQNGYGVVPTRGYGRDLGSDARAPRFFYINLVGAIPDNLHVLHTCDNRACCNPKHLFLGTVKDNSDDKVSKARQWRPTGEKHYNFGGRNPQFSEWHKNKDISGEKNPMYGRKKPRLSRENRIRHVKDILVNWSAL